MLKNLLVTLAATTICCSSMARAADKLSKDEQVFLRKGAVGAQGGAPDTAGGTGAQPSR